MRAALEGLREAAAARLDALEAALGALARERRGESDDDEHDPEGVTLSSEWSRLAGLVDGARVELEQADDALSRLAEGDYGVCERCGGAIPAARLEARPFAVRCVACVDPRR